MADRQDLEQAKQKIDELRDKEATWRRSFSEWARQFDPAKVMAVSIIVVLVVIILAIGSAFRGG
jgi:hypothetical protein